MKMFQKNKIYGNWEHEHENEIPEIRMDILRDNLEWAKQFSAIGVPSGHYQNLLKIVIAYMEKENEASDSIHRK
jgi:hypothetical protein